MLKKPIHTLPLTENFAYFIFTAVLHMKTSPKGGLAHFWVQMCPQNMVR